MENRDLICWHRIDDAANARVEPIFVHCYAHEACAMAGRWNARNDGAAYHVSAVRCHVLMMTLEDGGLNQIAIC